MQMKRDFDGMGFHFNGHVEFHDVATLNLTAFERGILDDCFAPDSTANHWLHALALLWEKFQAQAEARERYATTGVPILPMEGS
jgi:hypothetical protein